MCSWMILFVTNMYCLPIASFLRHVPRVALRPVSESLSHRRTRRANLAVEHRLQLGHPVVVDVHRLEWILQLPRHLVQPLVRHSADEVDQNRQPQVLDVTGDHDGHRQVEHHEADAQHLRVRHRERRLRDLIRHVEPQHAVGETLVHARQDRRRDADALSVLKPPDDQRLDPRLNQVGPVAVQLVQLLELVRVQPAYDREGRRRAALRPQLVVLLQQKRVHDVLSRLLSVVGFRVYQVRAHVVVPRREQPRRLPARLRAEIARDALVLGVHDVHRVLLGSAVPDSRELGPRRVVCLSPVPRRDDVPELLVTAQVLQRHRVHQGDEVRQPRDKPSVVVVVLVVLLHRRLANLLRARSDCAPVERGEHRHAVRPRGTHRLHAGARLHEAGQGVVRPHHHEEADDEAVHLERVRVREGLDDALAPELPQVQPDCD
mmetsp:Transcript_6768/g.29534  ORF Transcript_6768/g.29534 Transcript_6768/m.29534 type:complete len:432 (-) Transcript_6768:145-1440(-)